MAQGISQEGHSDMKIMLIVEGQSDSIIFNKQAQWFKSRGIDFQVILANGKSEMIKKARKLYKTSIYSGAQYVIFLPDQDSDTCGLVTRERIDVDSLPNAVTIALKRALEAWILADRDCINSIIDLKYRTSGQTDFIQNPKERLLNMMERKYGYRPTAVEAALKVAPFFSLDRASKTNTSTKRFKQFIEGRLVPN